MSRQVLLTIGDDAEVLSAIAEDLRKVFSVRDRRVVLGRGRDRVRRGTMAASP